MTVGWKHDIAVLNDFRADWNDKLEVSDEGLRLVKGRYIGSFVKPSVAVLRQLEALIEISKECFGFLKRAKCDLPEFYEQVVMFKREVKCLHLCLNDMRSVLDERLITGSSQLLDEVKAFKYTLKKPPLSERPVKHFVYDERMNPHSIKWTHPKRVPPEDTAAAALKALSLVEEESFFVTARLLGGVLKEALWDPFDSNGTHENLTHHYLSFQGRQRTAFVFFVKQLLGSRLITDEVVDAFAKLAHAVESLDLSRADLIAKDITELAPYIAQSKKAGAITPLAFLEAVKRARPDHAINLTYLSERYLSLVESYDLLAQKTSWDDFLKTHLSTLKLRKAHSFITLKVLLRLLEIAAASNSCRKIILSDTLTSLQPVSELLAKGYAQNESSWFKF